MTKANRTRLGKKIVLRMTGIRLLISVQHLDAGFSTQQLYVHSQVDFIFGELRFEGFGTTPNYFRIKVEEIMNIKEFDIERYEITMKDGTVIILQKHF